MSDIKDFIINKAKQKRKDQKEKINRQQFAVDIFDFEQD